ncbi:hypothetical protein [Defluviicoccus vanus]|uniref:Uncharacterized protein n=1 Tax=Defluviicoccus vanus TaxID=111831 RepID=A0A7H1MXD0_9PROT|nr:hypothetical protein [Defluviicoccus vanus]QNT68116.1 hypothetical protein HQ394_00520 [Defluviicoccus vanus]
MSAIQQKNVPESKASIGVTEAYLNNTFNCNPLACNYRPPRRDRSSRNGRGRDLRRIGLALCVASSAMTLASAVTLAVYLL